MSSPYLSVDAPHVSEDLPHGLCECRDNHGAAGCRGPAAWLVTRDGLKLRLCTRCDLSGDRDKVLLVVGSDPLQPYSSYDSLGALSISLHLSEAKR